MELTVLGHTVRHPIDHVEVFPAPANVDRRAVHDRRGRLDVPGHHASRTCRTSSSSTRRTQWCIESKSLKLYLWSFRDRAVFAEALAAEIAGEVMTTAKPQWVTVTLTQRPRGGIEVQAVAERRGPTPVSRRAAPPCARW